MRLRRREEGGHIRKKARRRAILAPEGATFATAVLNFRVRDGNGCAHRAIATRLLSERTFRSLKTGYSRRHAQSNRISILALDQSPEKGRRN